MRFISVDGLSTCRGSEPCIREGLNRRFIFEVRLSGPFEWRFSLNFRLIIGMWEWRHDMQIANMLLLRNPRGTCVCGDKNDWLCIRQHVGILGGVGSPLPRFFPSLLLSVLPSLVACYVIGSCSCFFKKTNKKTRSRSRRRKRRRRRYTLKPHFCEQERGKNSLPKGISPQYGDPRRGWVRRNLYF